MIGSRRKKYSVKRKIFSSNLYFILLIMNNLIRRYANAVQNGPRVARYLAQFIRFLIQNRFKINRIHLIGFSLGAAVAGMAGKILKEWDMELSRITGMYNVESSIYTIFVYYYLFICKHKAMTIFRLHFTHKYASLQ